MSHPSAPPALDVTALLPFLARALEEDRAEQDVTTRTLVDDDRVVTADVVAKAPGVLAGLALAEPVFRFLDPEAEVALHYDDGESVAERSRILTVTGRARAILSAERTVLDVLGHLSGVATTTRAFVEAVEGTPAKILDTRKTTPGWRVLEKYAVRCGGGENHRLDLADAAMVKENHLYAAWGHTGEDAIRRATRALKESLPPGVLLYVEVENLEELDAAMAEGADVVMLDGFDLGDIREAVRRRRTRTPPRPVLEITGGVRLENVAAFAATGVERISIGALTHSSPQLDLSLRIRATS
jgi:nicotinate-nucleotide pyrophosphorylase (carboxylating)